MLTVDEQYVTPRMQNIIKKPCRIGNECRIGQNLNFTCITLEDCVSINAGSVMLEPYIKSYEVWAEVPAKYIERMSYYDLSI